jgi:hypothetical protein
VGYVRRDVVNVSVLMRDLPQLAAVSKEAIAVAASFLAKSGYAVLAPSPGSRSKALTLTPKGRHALADYEQRIVAIEGRWCAAFEPGVVDRLRGALEAIVVEPAAAAARSAGRSHVRTAGEQRSQRAQHLRISRW